MSIRVQIWDFIAGREVITRAEFYAQFGECRKALSRMVGLGELLRDGDTYRPGVRFEGQFRPWGVDEEAVIRAYMHEGWNSLCERLPGRTRTAIKGKAANMGVTAEVKAERGVNLDRVATVTRLPVFTRGNLSPAVRSCLAVAA